MENLGEGAGHIAWDARAVKTVHEFNAHPENLKSARRVSECAENFWGLQATRELAREHFLKF